VYFKLFFTTLPVITVCGFYVIFHHSSSFESAMQNMLRDSIGRMQGWLYHRRLKHGNRKPPVSLIKQCFPFSSYKNLLAIIQTAVKKT
jgi:hypothetical protein